jgi:hypothetical protein
LNIKRVEGFGKCELRMWGFEIFQLTKNVQLSNTRTHIERTQTQVSSIFIWYGVVRVSYVVSVFGKWAEKTQYS